MSDRQNPIAKVAPALSLAAALLVPGAALAQVPTVDPGGGLSDPAAPPPAAEPAPPPRAAPPPAAALQSTGQPGAAPAAGEEIEEGFYHTDDYGELGGEGMTDEGGGRVQVHGGAVPPVHVVRRGDTLWDISWFYFNSPWEWPRVWSYNPEITNPHWIYPGDQVRLGGGGGGEVPAEQGPAPGPEEGGAPVATARRATAGDAGYELRQLAFVASEDLDLAIQIEGSPEEKMMLAAGDEVYLSYPEGRPPKVGQRLSVYRERQRVKHPKSGEEVGAYVTIVGELEVVSALKDKLARGVVLDSVDVIERGMKVGPLVRQFKDVEPTPARSDVEGTVVAELQAESLIGARQIVFIDRGSEHGVVAGNRFHVVRRGDAYEKKMGSPKSHIGKNDPRYPARSLGEVMVVQVGKQSSVAVVTRSAREFGVGDRVLMVRGRSTGK